MRLPAIIASLAVAAALAESPAQLYLWDRRAFCTPGENAPQCAISAWPTYQQASKYLATLFDSEQFSVLENALDNICASPRRFVGGRPVSISAYIALGYMFPSGGERPAEMARLARWKAAVPQSKFTAMVDAFLLRESAWRIRGGGYANTVSPESWALFDKRLRESEEVLRGAPESAKQTPLWHDLLLEDQLDRGGPESVQGLLEAAAKRWPDYFPFYERIAQRLVPKWGGSWRDVDAFADKWARRHSEHDGFYTRIYLFIKNEGAVGEMAIDWARMKRGFRELTTRYPDPYFRNYFASYACAVRDRPAYVEAMKLIDKETLRTDFWLKGNSHEACSRWGVTET